MVPAFDGLPLHGRQRDDLDVREGLHLLLEALLDVERVGVARVAQDLQHLALDGDPFFSVSSRWISPAAIWPISTVPATEVRSDGVEVICRSKIITGMPAARAFSIAGLRALKSTAARMIASGLSVDDVVHLALLDVGLVVGIERHRLVADVASGTFRSP